jgi:hypothetical protein
LSVRQTQHSAHQQKILACMLKQSHPHIYPLNKYRAKLYKNRAKVQQKLHIRKFFRNFFCRAEFYSAIMNSLKTMRIAYIRYTHTRGLSIIGTAQLWQNSSLNLRMPGRTRTYFRGNLRVSLRTSKGRCPKVQLFCEL